ncbi:MAG TPA: hypothetical protein VFH27_01235 [Longimicrobiaceae bacterium]|nr:hypothetical protein [Longimicrobiaceae bacterium]
MLRQNRLAALVMLGSLVMSACGDLATSAESAARPSRQSSVAIRSEVLRSLHICNTSDLHPTGGHPYRYTREALRFPKNELAADGGTQEFRLRVRMPGQTAVAAANCRIPNTTAAAERMYRTFERMFAGRAKLNPMNSDLLDERRRTPAGTSGTGGAPAGPHFTDVALEGVTVTAQPVNEGGATGWTGWEWGWGSAGDGPQNTGGGTGQTSGDSPEPAPAPAMEGPILAVIVCLVGFLGVAYTVDDAYDQMKQLLDDKRQAALDRAAYDAKAGEVYYTQEAWEEDATERRLLAYIADQSDKKYHDDLHALAVKMNVSEYAVAAGTFACAGAAVVPSP